MGDTVAKKESVLTKKDLRKSWMIWLRYCCCSNNWERMQNLIYTV